MNATLMSFQHDAIWLKLITGWAPAQTLASHLVPVRSQSTPVAAEPARCPGPPHTYCLDASFMQLWCDAGQLLLNLNGLAPCMAVSVVPQGLWRTAVTAGTGLASASYDVDAATMHMERHERGIHAL
jgi:hypothetical protein